MQVEKETTVYCKITKQELIALVNKEGHSVPPDALISAVVDTYMGSQTIVELKFSYVEKPT